jgi:hypothetical protein
MDAAVARSVAYYSHTDMRDSAGGLVVEHVARVAAAVPDVAGAVAWLHDLTTTDLGSVERLRAEGLTDMELAALTILQRGSDESYEAHVLRVAHAPGPAGHVARLVKLAELDDQIASARVRQAGCDDVRCHWARRHLAWSTAHLDA